MSPALPLLRIRVGVVVERRKTDSPWIDFIWRGIGVLPDEPNMEPWTLLREQEEATLFYAGSAAVDLYPSETARYRENLASGNPSIWIILSPSDGPKPYVVAAATADPAEGEAFTEAGANLVEAVAMPEVIRELIESFIAEHHVEREFVKRKQSRVDPEALGRRHDQGSHDE
jgi:ribosomal protein S12 methylthiotransferase accessory factor YcaO